MAGRQGARIWLAVAPMADRTTPLTDVSKFKPFPFSGAGGKLMRTSKPSAQLFGAENRFVRAENQHSEAAYTIEFRMDGMAMILNTALKRSTSDVHLIDATNDTIYFTRSGSHTATIAHATYATSGALATAVAAAMNTADSGQTYTCTYSSSTHKMTLANGAAFVLVLSTATTAAWTLLGFTGGVDTSSTTSHAGASAVAPTAYDHQFTIPVTGRYNESGIQGNQIFGTQLWECRDTLTQEALFNHLLSYNLAWSEGQFHAPMVSLGFQGSDLYEIANPSFTNPVLGTAAPYDPDGTLTQTIVLNGHTYTAFPAHKIAANLAIPNQLGYSVGNRKPIRVRRGGKFNYTYEFDFDQETDLVDDAAAHAFSDDFDAVWRTASGTAAIALTQTGANIRSTVNEQISLSMPVMRPTGDGPAASQGTIQRSYKFAAQYDVPNDAPGYVLTLRSTEAIADV